MKHPELLNSLNNAIAYSYVLGWYAGRDGKLNDSGKIRATRDIKEKHPDIVQACDNYDDLSAACKEAVGFIDKWSADDVSKAYDILKAAIAKAGAEVQGPE